ncbi:hypothetical protein [Eilatimonas milleporae]|uniref:Uncharacterized protein n=1 Tax=Eilatimonas milleporae TaxID=911205 RepID=A0A3M0CGA7_9PROT|nr:hypothetical protein [Eilatimonas milleporae]RMB08015.1 hypothetical protein BXY39_2110 [Eilatimonas milleporae]
MTTLVKYDVTVPDAEIDVKVDVDKGAVVATVTDVPPVSFHLSPKGNWAQKILSKILQPIASDVADDFKNKPSDILKGQSKTIGKNFSHDVEGVTVTLSDPALGKFTAGSTDMLKITGTITVTKES